jgi:hypothetical protein
MLYKLDSDFCILVMESGASVTIADALSYLALDIKIAPEQTEEEQSNESETDEVKPDDDPTLPKVSQASFDKTTVHYQDFLLLF